MIKQWSEVGERIQGEIRGTGEQRAWEPRVREARVAILMQGKGNVLIFLKQESRSIWGKSWKGDAY